MRELVYGCRCTYLCACMYSYFYAYTTVSMCARTYVLINVSLNVCINSRTDKYMYALYMIMYLNLAIYTYLFTFTYLHVLVCKYITYITHVSRSVHVRVCVHMFSDI